MIENACILSDQLIVHNFSNVKKQKRITLMVAWHISQTVRNRGTLSVGQFICDLFCVYSGKIKCYVRIYSHFYLVWIFDILKSPILPKTRNVSYLPNLQITGTALVYKYFGESVFYGCRGIGSELLTSGLNAGNWMNAVLISTIKSTLGSFIQFHKYKRAMKDKKNSRIVWCT